MKNVTYFGRDQLTIVGGDPTANGTYVGRSDLVVPTRRPEYGLNDAPCPICGGEKQTITAGRNTKYGEYERFIIRGFCSLGCARASCD